MKKTIIGQGKLEHVCKLNRERDGRDTGEKCNISEGQEKMRLRVGGRIRQKKDVLF